MTTVAGIFGSGEMRSDVALDVWGVGADGGSDTQVADVGTIAGAKKNPYPA